MAEISGILCETVTSDVTGADTNGTVYLGIGGREFHIDSTANDFERGAIRYYILGAVPLSLSQTVADVLNKDGNDPRTHFPLDTDDLGLSPVYVRFEPNSAQDNWSVGAVNAVVFTSQSIVAYSPSLRFEKLWLGHAFGKTLYLTFQQPILLARFLESRPTLAAKVGAR